MMTADHSLRLRLIVGGVLAILIALTVSGVGLVVLFERHATRTIGDDLSVYLNQLVAGIDVDAQGGLAVTREPTDPRFAEPLSGLYWQVADGRGQTLRSRSLWDTALKLEPDSLAPGAIHQHVIAGPSDSRVLVAERIVSLTQVNGRVPVRVAVAADLGRVSRAAAGFAKDLSLALGLLAIVLALATAIQVGMGLQPLKSLRERVADVRAGRIRHLPPAAPAEVQPLVEEVNALLDAQEQEIERSRGRAADLAHGLKTPLAALIGDARRLRAAGQSDVARDIESVSQAMSRIVDRELARARSRGAVRHKVGLSTELAPLVHSLLATLSRTPACARVSFDPQIPTGLRVPIDRTDLAEILGNVLDNAARHAASRVHIIASQEPSGASIVIEDDGLGIPLGAEATAMQRGVRLDERLEGSGLGLAIVRDILDTYDWRLVLGKSDTLGGLRVMLAPNSQISPLADRLLTLRVRSGTPWSF
jgi:signal transduction histidine kinase